VLVLINAAFFSRIQCNLMLDSLGSDFVRTARAKGLPQNRAVVKHALIDQTTDRDAVQAALARAAAMAPPSSPLQTDPDPAFRLVGWVSRNDDVGHLIRALTKAASGDGIKPHQPRNTVWASAVRSSTNDPPRTSTRQCCPGPTGWIPVIAPVAKTMPARTGCPRLARIFSAVARP
jgi:hypothetical protein